MKRRILRSGDLELDLGVHQVRDAGRVVDVAPRLFDLLLCLMRRAPETVSRDALVREVWHEVHVCESAVTQAVRALRAAVGDCEAHGRIVTVRGRGYRFDASVTHTEIGLVTEGAPRARREAMATGTTGEPTVLLVDDERDILDALARTLRGVGCRFVKATSGAEALAVVDRERIDVVLSDIDMPDMSGLTLISRIRATHPDTVRLILTGVASLDAALRAINDGEVHRFLTKPWESAELRKIVGEALVRRSLPRITTSHTGPSEAQLGDRDQSALPPMTPPLSPRLRQTLVELLTGAREKEIADRLGVSPHTAHQYVKALYRRFDVASRVELIVKLQPGRGGLAYGDAASRGASS